MGDLLTTGGVLAAFFDGGVALFAPCCIVFLAPSYLAAAVKNRRWRLLPLGESVPRCARYSLGRYMATSAMTRSTTPIASPLRPLSASPLADASGDELITTMPIIKATIVTTIARA